VDVADVVVDEAVVDEQDAEGIDDDDNGDVDDVSSFIVVDTGFEFVGGVGMVVEGIEEIVVTPGIVDIESFLSGTTAILFGVSAP